MAGVFSFNQLPQRMTKLGNHVGGKAIDRVVKNAATAFGSVVVDRTGVDTGKARSNWRASLGRPIGGKAREPYAPGKKLGIGETANKQAVKAQQQANIIQYKAQLHRSIFFTNRTSYIETINNTRFFMVEQGIQALRVAARATPLLKGR